MFLLDYHIHTSTSAWIYENSVSKHFVDCFNFPCLSLFTVLFAYVILFYFTLFFFGGGGGWGVVLWLGICVKVAVEGIS